MAAKPEPETETEPAPYLKVLLHPVPPIMRIADRPFNIYSLHYILKKSYQFDSWKFIVRHVAVAVVATHEPRPRHKKRKRNEKSVQESEPDATATVVAVVVDGLRRLPGLFFCCCFVFRSFEATFNATPRSQSRTGAGAAAAAADDDDFRLESASVSSSSSTRE